MSAQLYTPGYQDSISAQLGDAERELSFLDEQFSVFLADTEHNLWDFVFGTNNQVEDTTNAARAAIASSIALLHSTFLDAAGGKPIDWQIWWELAKDTEAHMGATSKYSNAYGDVGGRADVTAGVVGAEVKEKADAILADVKGILPSEGKLWLGVGIVVLVLFLILAIKLS